ncbi:MAG: SDR family oxidoreductase [Deltaproteobacteria bacterium]|nr:SDR family oxidoreductase [Deltaproteobacteria bacterium]
MKLKDRVALVTGGGRGIGQAIAIAFAEEGADVIVAARSVDELEETVQRIEATGRKGIAVPVDLSQGETIASFVETIASHRPAVDILVNNAGIGSGMNAKLVVDFDDDFWDTSIRLNLTVPYLLSKAFMPSMIEAGWGRVINISSVVGKMGFLTGAAYSASKHGLIGLTRTAALETATTGVTVNAICPGPIRTPMLARRIQVTAEMNNVSIEQMEKSLNPMQRLLEPEEVASLAVFLAADSAKSITGQSYNVSGGMVVH